MATYTPNLSLYMPDSTDDFGEFREEHNDNMVKIDNAIGGGGGSGGHTIVNPSGSDMPAEGKLQFTGGVTVTDDSVNGKTVVDISGGGGNVYGAFIDTNRLITSGQYSSGSPLSYTATEDCFVYGVCTLTNNTSGSVSIDGVQVGGWYNGGGTTTYNFGFLVKNGQTITASQTFSGNSDYKVYGLTQGTNGIFTPIIYSDTERVVGVWRDNKPLYQRTWTGTKSTNAEEVVISGLTTLDTLVDSMVIFKGNTGAQIAQYFRDASDFGRCWYDNNGIHMDLGNSYPIRPATWYITLWYTKTTDVAGSGNWNTDGVPTVHYSTSEQVIGTWLGKPLYQRTWDFISTNIINANTWTNLFSNDIDIDKITMNETLDDEGRSNKVAYCGVRNGYVAVYSTYTTNIQTITLRYTKSTD